jgi:probable blue pigment (indigoidine) exporter
MVKKETNKSGFLLQVLFVIFIWSAARIIMKIGLEEIPPYIFVAAIQLLAFVSVWLYSVFKKNKSTFKPTKQEIYLLIISGAVGYGAANLFAIIGLQYVTGATAGVISASSSIFAFLMAYLVLREKPDMWKYLGMAVMVAGIYIFFTGSFLSGTLFGVLLLLISEAGYAFNDVLTRLVGRQPGDEDLAITVISNGVGAAILVPIGLVMDGVPSAMFSWPLIGFIVLLGLIFGFGRLLYAGALEKLRVMEVQAIGNTMVVQVAILSVIFLHEVLTTHNILGGILVLIGAFAVNGNLIMPNGLPKLKLGL